ncbi:MAG: class I SAM-dependent methyltransferase [Anaerolineae bacterium]|nr:class I SAM-dependent methyltransferase [Anaerolineae bacterium]
MDIREHNRIVWDQDVEWGENPWTIPVSPEQVAAARCGEWGIYLTPTKPVPRAWFPPFPCDLLCLASGGGQQGPILAAAGARVTVFDNSPRQLGQDRMVAEREGLEIRTVEGDMRDLAVFPDEGFDLIVHPVSNVFIPDAHPVWHEAFRVLRPGGALLSGFDNPVIHTFDQELYERGVLQVKYALPYSEADILSEEERQRLLERGEPLEFSHTLEEQIGGQIEAGFLIAGFYEDADPGEALARYMPIFIATRAIKPQDF